MLLICFSLFKEIPSKTHNHLLVKGDIIRDIISHSKSKGLIGEHVKHEPYREGANMYVAKYICDDKVNYNLIKNS